MNALADPQVGTYLNENFVAAFQKVGTFRIVGQQKQGGNVASYFCAPDGRVLHVVAGPVDAETLLREARWVVETVKSSLEVLEQRGNTFKALFRQAHANRLKGEHYLTVEPVTFDAPVASSQSALSYHDPTGRPLAPILPAPPVEGPDVSLTKAQQDAFYAEQEIKKRDHAAGLKLVADRRGRRWALSNQGRVHILLAAHSMKNIETLYGSIFEGILGEKVSTKPVEVDNPFPWYRSASPTAQLQIRVPGR